MTLIHHHQKIVREVIQQTEGPLTGQTPVKIARVVLNAGAVAQFAHHFEVKLGTFLNAPWPPAPETPTRNTAPA